MKNFLRIAEGVDVVPLLLEIQRRPELWDANKDRKEYESTPHGEMSDIWIRHAESKEAFHGPHFAKWYPAFRELPSVRKLIFDSMSRVQASHLGGVLITRVPAGCAILPHSDNGWHPEFYNCKLYVVLETNPKCWFRVEDEVVAMKQGDVWRIDNTKEHEVVNDGDSERMTLIICMRQE